MLEEPPHVCWCPVFGLGATVRQGHCMGAPQGVYLFCKKWWERGNVSFRTLTMVKNTIIFNGGCRSVGEGVRLFSFSTRHLGGSCVWKYLGFGPTCYHHTALHNTQIMRLFIFRRSSCFLVMPSWQEAEQWSWFDLWLLPCAHILPAELLRQGGAGGRDLWGRIPVWSAVASPLKTNFIQASVYMLGRQRKVSFAGILLLFRSPVRGRGDFWGHSWC